MSSRVLVLVPPSEGKAGGGTGEPWTPGRCVLPALDDARTQVLAAADRARPAGAPALADAPTRPAIERYTGVLYRELDAAALPGPARRRLHARLLIASGLWGVVGTRDPIPEYRLKMGARLAPMGRLSTWWRPRLTDALSEVTAGATVWNLLPAEHAAAVDWDRLPARQLVTVRFVDAQGRTVSHWNKLLKGALVRWMAETGAGRPDDLAGFDHPTGYALDRAASDWDRRRPVLVLRGAEGASPHVRLDPSDR